MRVIPILLALVISVPAFAGYKDKIMKPWMGATKDELVKKWGYPVSRNDLVKIDDETVVFTYVSSYCKVSFTIEGDVVTGWKYRKTKGYQSGCPKIKRYKKSEASSEP